ncbi:MAG TPA: hypothetical protein VM364_15515 [Vicinamibacterales bacterium]|nr:hypothetical protein [Vicinamibacterales bacterium]
MRRIPRRMLDRFSRPSAARLVLGVTLVVAWLNFLLTQKWAYIPGALNGSKRPWYAAALLAASILTIWGRRTEGPVALGVPALRLLVAAAGATLAGGFLLILPPSTWSLIPFDDDWAPRYQATVEGLRLLRQGAVVGWQWAMLGGHQTSADLSQSLVALGALPMLLFGDRVGYHLLHALVVAGIPVLVYRDAASDGRRELALVAALFATIFTVGMYGTIMPSGDTNSIAGVFAVLVALAGSRLARQGHTAGAVLLVAGVTLTAYTHLGFLLYAALYLLLEAVFYRDWRMALRAAVAGAAGGLASLPLYVELIAYPEYFITNNLLYAPAADWGRIGRSLFYNTEILLHPHRWFNDYLSLANVTLPLLAWIALRPGGSRARFHAWMALLTLGLLRLNVVDAGYLMARQMHMMVAVLPAPLAAFVIDYTGSRRLAWILVAIVGLYPYATFHRVPHVEHPREFDPLLVERLATRDGNLVLLENSPHRDLDQHPERRTERTPFGVHFESLVAEATGKRLYGQTWDGWHWTPFRGQVVAAGSFRGQAIGLTPIDAFVAEMRKWGVRHLLVWSTPTRAYLDAAPARFRRQWTSGPWVEYELVDADPRSVVTESGAGRLENLHLLGGEVHLADVRAGDRVVVRTNYFPAWRAHAAGREIPLTAASGQLAFDAPADGTCVVSLEYPRRRPLILLALAGLLAGVGALTAFDRRTRRTHGSGPPA